MEFIIQEYLVDPDEGSLSGLHGWWCVKCHLGKAKQAAVLATRCADLNYRWGFLDEFSVIEQFYDASLPENEGRQVS